MSTHLKLMVYFGNLGPFDDVSGENGGDGEMGGPLMTQW